MRALKNRVRTTPPLARVVQHPSRGAHLSQPPRLHTRPHMTRERTSTVLDSMCLRHKSNPHSLQILPPSRRPPLQPSCAPLHGSPSSLPRISAQTPVCRPCVWRTGAGLLPLPTPRHVPTVWPRLQARPIPTERAAVRPPTVLLSACCPRAVHALSTRCPYAVRTLSARYPHTVVVRVDVVAVGVRVGMVTVSVTVGPTVTPTVTVSTLTPTVSNQHAVRTLSARCPRAVRTLWW